MEERTLSCFCDESGDFGPLSSHSPVYLLAFVFHDQAHPVDAQLGHLERAIGRCGFPPAHAVHTAPLVRREGLYADADPRTRKALFDAIFSFFRHCDVSVKTLAIPKKEFGCGDELAGRIARELGQFVRDNLAWFQSYDRVVVYYDRGQKQVSRILSLIFQSMLSNVEFRVVSPEGYRLFQVADMACTLELADWKRARGGLSKSEAAFFSGAKNLKRTYLRRLREKGA